MGDVAQLDSMLRGLQAPPRIRLLPSFAPCPHSFPTLEEARRTAERLLGASCIGLHCRAGVISQHSGCLTRCQSDCMRQCDDI